MSKSISSPWLGDCSDEGLVVAGIYRRLQVSHRKLCARGDFVLVAYPHAKK
jgi:hypothetical protein